jgi:hypothetical protein
MSRRREGAASGGAVLFVEAVRMRPTAEAVLNAFYQLAEAPTSHLHGQTSADLAQHAGLTPHVVRARLCDLRRLGLVASAPLYPWHPRHLWSPRPLTRSRHRLHALTPEGWRRQACPQHLSCKEGRP